MKKTAIFIFYTIFILCIFIPLSALSTRAEVNTDVNVKIGLSNYANLQNININNSNLQVGYSLNDNFNLIYSLNSNSGFNIKKLNFNYIKLTESFSSYNEALDYISKNKISDNIHIALTGISNWSIYIGEFSSQTDAENFLANENIKGSVINSVNMLGIYLEESLFFIFDLKDFNLQIKSNSEIISLSGKDYRGIIEFKNNSTTFNLINVLSLEEYLYGVVPSEMPSTWQEEALKAQAVASRSYAYNMIKSHSHSSDGYDLCDTTHCQVYNGVSSERESTTNAINATRGVFAYYDGSPITAFYYSSNGGYTESSENVWNNPLGYLKSFEDTYETGGKVWERTFTFEQLTNLAGSIGNVTEVTIITDKDSKRVSSFILTGEKGTKTLEKETIRTFFSSAGGSLESRNFTILGGNESISQATDLYVITNNSTNSLDLTSLNVVASDDKIYKIDKSNVSIITDKATTGSNSTSNANVISISSKDTDTVVFSGKGWGHGVGMSQYGANSMASLGYSYVDILKFYYKGIEVR